MNQSEHEKCSKVENLIICIIPGRTLIILAAITFGSNFWHLGVSCLYDATPQAIANLNERLCGF